LLKDSKDTPKGIENPEDAPIPNPTQDSTHKFCNREAHKEHQLIPHLHTKAKAKPKTEHNYLQNLYNKLHSRTAKIPH